MSFTIALLLPQVRLNPDEPLLQPEKVSEVQNLYWQDCRIGPCFLHKRRAARFPLISIGAFRWQHAQPVSRLSSGQLLHGCSKLIL
jgi:hypothetical protein